MTRRDVSPPSTARRYWARRMVDRAAPTWPIPRYGSAEWLTLPDGSPVKVAAVVIAAECWATGEDELPDRMRVIAEAAGKAFKADEDADYVTAYQHHKTTWRHLRLVNQPDVTPSDSRPNDHPGGPVRWSGGGE